MIFVNTHIINKITFGRKKHYKDAKEIGEKYRVMCLEILKYDEVTIFTDLTKSQYIEVLNSVQSKADRLERVGEDVLSVALINVGYYLNLELEEHHSIAKAKGYVAPQKDINDS